MGTEDNHSRRRPVVNYDARLAMERPAYARSRQRVEAQREDREARREALLQRTGKKDTRQSLVDLEAASRGTNAAEGSQEFDTAFARDADGKPMGNKPEAWRRRFENGGRRSESGSNPVLPLSQRTAEARGNPQGASTSQGAYESPHAPGSQAPQASQELPPAQPSSMVSNPPPATNFRPGDSGTNTLADVRTVAYTPPPNFRRDKNGVPVDSLEQIARANKEWLDSGMGKHVVSTTEKPRVSPDAGLKSRKMQALLDANVNPGAQQEVARALATPGRNVGTQYGNIAVRDGAGDAKNADGTPLAEAVPFANGVVRDTANVWQKQLMQKYPEIGQRDSEANKRFVAAWKEAGASQGPNSNGSAGADPMKVAQKVTQDLGKQRETMYGQQTRNFFNPSARIPMTNSTVSLGDQVKVAPPATRETIPLGVKGVTFEQETAAPQFKGGDFSIGRKSAESAGVNLSQVSIGNTPFSQVPQLPPGATRPVQDIADLNPSPFTTPKVDIPGVPALPKPPRGGVGFFSGPSGPNDVSIPGGISKIGPSSPITWGGMGEKAGLTLKDKPDDNDLSQTIAKP